VTPVLKARSQLAQNVRVISEPPALRFDDVSVRFGEFTALEGVTFEVPHGAFLAVVGPNGAGKSTLMRAALGLVAPTRGRALVYGQPPGTGARRVGYVPQIKTFDRSFPAQAIELVLSGVRGAWPGPLRRAERDLALGALARAGAEHLAFRPLGRLSGGELQRTYLARALVREPDLILLDEPATGIDTLGEQDMYALLERERRARTITVAMITHDWDVAHHHATHVAVLNRRLFACDRPALALCEDCLSRAYGHGQHAHVAHAALRAL